MQRIIKSNLSSKRLIDQCKMNRILSLSLSLSLSLFLLPIKYRAHRACPCYSTIEIASNRVQSTLLNTTRKARKA